MNFAWHMYTGCELRNMSNRLWSILNTQGLSDEAKEIMKVALNRLSDVRLKLEEVCEKDWPEYFNYEIYFNPNER